jgi:ABC-2 type transport system ATP-binding protein
VDAPATASIVVEGLSHRYPQAARLALDDVGFSVPAGQRLGLLGPNGAGKSTLMRILCGFLPVDERTTVPRRVAVAGYDVRTHSLDVRDRVGYLPEQVPLYPELRVREHLAFRASIKRVPRRKRSAEVQRVAEMTGLTDRIEQPIGQLSRGYRQRVGIADALLGSPAVIVLDEPTVGLDPNQVLDIRAMLRDLGGDHTLVFSSHILAEVEMLCDRVVILSEGKVVADESLSEALRSGVVRGRLRADDEQARRVVSRAWSRFVPDDDGPGPSPAFEGLHDGVIELSLMVPHDASDRVDELLAALGEVALEEKVAVLSLAPGQTRLEERFAEVTGARRKA